MDFKGFQDECRTTAKYPQATQIQGLTYTILGMAGEVGELANKFKKVLRGDHGEELMELPEHLKMQMVDELGDVLWYAAEVATQLGIRMEYAAMTNVAKLLSRKDRGMINGSGDQR